MDVQPAVSLTPAHSVSILHQVSEAPEVKAAEAAIARAEKDHDQVILSLHADPRTRPGMCPQLYSQVWQNVGKPARMNGILVQAAIGGAGLIIGLTRALGPPSGIIGIMMMGFGVLATESIVRAHTQHRVDAAMTDALSQEEKSLAAQLTASKQQLQQTRDAVFQRLVAQAAREELDAEKERAARAANLGPVVVGDDTVELGHIRVPRKG